MAATRMAATRTPSSSPSWRAHLTGQVSAGNTRSPAEGSAGIGLAKESLTRAVPIPFSFHKLPLFGFRAAKNAPTLLSLVSERSALARHT
jgi:hypothetical protein